MLARSFSHTVRTRVKVQGKSCVAKAFFFLLNSFLKNTSLPFANSALDSTAFVHSGWTILTHEHCIDSRIICCFHRGEWYKRSRSSTPPKIISGLLYRTKEQDYYFYRTKGHINVITFFRWMIRKRNWIECTHSAPTSCLDSTMFEWNSSWCAFSAADS